MPRRALPGGGRRTRADDRASAARRGYNYAWRKAARRYLVLHPLCRHCEAAGRVTPATVVDHRVRHRGQRDPLFWDQSNWQPLCVSCHNRKTAREQR